MRKKTGPQTGKPRKDSRDQESGLIAKAERNSRTAQGRNVLDNRSHRTTGDVRTLRARPLVLPWIRRRTVDHTKERLS
jgi:hypothetical protein